MSIANSNPSAVRIAVIGIGARGLLVLERLCVALSGNAAGRRVEILAIDPAAEPGAGLHSPDDREHLLLNTVAGQLSIFHAAGRTPEGRRGGPTFLEWCRDQDIRIDERNRLCPPKRGRSVEYGDFLPRAPLARYLRDCYARIVDSLPPNVSILHIPQRAMRCESAGSGERFIIHLASGETQHAHAVFLTLGHVGLEPSTVDLDSVCAGEPVAVLGLGLTAVDTIAGLTEGRGGRHVMTARGQRYEPSGREPHILVYSATGLPYFARPQWRASDPPPAPCLYLTRCAIDALRKTVPDGRLDFETQVLPLICDEMRAAYYRTAAALESPEAVAETTRVLQAAVAPATRAEIFAALADRFGSFEPLDWMRTRPWQGDPHDYAQWFRDWLAADLALARQGAAKAPVKAALEVWRNAREMLRYAVDRGGLTEASAQDFYTRWAPLGNRLVGGPQKERHGDLLALIDAGIVEPLPPMDIVDRSCDGHATLESIGGGTAPLRREVNQIVPAWVAPSGLSSTSSELLQDMNRRGELRAAGPAPRDGVEIDAVGRVVRQTGVAHRRMWAFGPHVEGSTFYNHYVSTVDPECRALRETASAVSDCLRELGLAAGNGDAPTPTSVRGQAA